VYKRQISFGLATAVGFTTDLIALFTLGTAIPTGLVLTVLTAQYQSGSGTAAAIVFLGTVLSAATITAWIYALKIAGYLPPMPA
jgi:predicted permease